MKTLQPVILKDSHWHDLEKKIAKFYEDAIYRPLIQELRADNIEIENAGDALIDALKSGRVYYDSGKIKGDFNSGITKAIRAYGGKYQASSKSYLFADSLMTPDIKSAIAISEMRMAGLQSKIINKIDSLNIQEAMRQYEFNFDDEVKRIDKDLNKTLAKISVPVKMTSEQIDIIGKEWGENLELYIKEWAEDNIIKLRREILQNTQRGKRASVMAKYIEKEYNSSRKKAKFLARQETSLLMSKMRETRYKGAGLFKYEWVASNDERTRHDHEILDGKIFDWDNPPVVDRATGRRAHAGEDFNCRCIAKPVIEF